MHVGSVLQARSEVASGQRVLVVHQDRSVRQLFSSLEPSFSITVLPFGPRVIAYLDAGDPDFVLLGLPPQTPKGEQLFSRLASLGRGVILVAAGESWTAWPPELSEQFSRGPCPLTREEAAEMLRSLEASWGAGKDPGPSGSTPLEVVAESPAMRELLSLAQTFARYKSAVLLTGESGTGKELLARTLHRLSDRHCRPFVAVNCAAIPEPLLESELFGHVRGAFTGAFRHRRGILVEASGGTLFLDEIGSLPLALQAKLLRVLETELFRPVGDSKERKVDIRLICATSLNLERAVRDERFREDLLYRINVLALHIPPLRERKEDIAPLVAHVLRLTKSRLGHSVESAAEDAMELLAAYSWPGNVRELEHVIERAVILSTGRVLEARVLPPSVRLSPVPQGLEEELSIKRQTRRLERELIIKALVRTGGNRTRAAKLLEISHRALLYKIREYGLAAGDGTDGES